MASRKILLRVLGAYYLTLPRRDADLLIAFTAVFIAFVSSRTWRILCFALHRLCSTPAILRNSSSPENGIHLFIKPLWANQSTKKYFRVLSSAIIGILCVITSFTVSGGFSSQISTRIGDEVLVSGQNCGVFNLQVKIINDAANYAHQCYSAADGGRVGCDRFKATCPFSSSICRDGSANLRINSGYRDSHTDLGLNAPSNQRVLWRNVIQCSPLKTKGFTSQRTTTAPNMTLYHYGSCETSDGRLDYIHDAGSVRSQYLSIFSNLSMECGSRIKDRIIEPDISDFMPIGPLSQTDADVYIFLLSGNGVVHEGPLSDDWYQISPIPSNVVVGAANASFVTKAFLPLEPASPLGCVDQYQFCSTEYYEGTSGCGPLASLRDAAVGAAPFFDTGHADFWGNIQSGEPKEGRAAWFMYFVSRFLIIPLDLAGTFGKMGSAALISQRTIKGSYQGPLVPNQWQLDISHVWNITMASRQAVFIDLLNVPKIQYWINFTTPTLQALCQNQKVRSAEYGPFSVFGFCFTFAVGSLAILVSYLLEPVSTFLYRQCGQNQYAHLEWITNATLQLQRLAHEEIGLGTCFSLNT
ncbi:hypothetical protein GGR54DRAFT_632289 [Hypoxylon sp. NC1633]|nr:hypothetical protein GGR54DRAFT_632289 [Hypoxylon sp. NC1633]